MAMGVIMGMRARLRAGRARVALAMRRQHGGDRQHSGKARYRVLASLAQGFGRRTPLGRYFHRETHMSPPHGEAVDQAGFDDIFAGNRVPYGL
jgi:hypothetical protein